MRVSSGVVALIAATVAAVSCASSTDPEDAKSITITPAGDTIDLGTSLQLTTVVKGASGQIMTPRVFWQSSDLNRVGVSETGLITGKLVGSANIDASVTLSVRKTATFWVRVPAYGRYTMDTIGVVMGPSTIGQQPGETTGTPDASAIELPDGRIRLYHGQATSSVVGGPGATGSAISTDGVHFTAEAGLRQPADAAPGEGFSSPLVYPLPGGGYRLYYNGCHKGRCGIASSTSPDGLTFTADNATGLGEFTALDQPACGGIVPIAAGRYRMYCSQLVSTAPTPAGTSAVYSATSSDLLNWTPDPGVRIGPGAPALTLDARHPTAIVNADGTVSLIFYRRRSGVAVPPLETIATSKDGLTFGDESDLGVGGTEPTFLRKRDGTMWIYYGNHSPATGSVVSVARLKPIVR